MIKAMIFLKKLVEQFVKKFLKDLILSQKRSIKIAGHKTSISIEKPYWDALKEIAKNNKTSLVSIIQQIDVSQRDNANLSSAIRLFVLSDLQKKLDICSLQNKKNPKQ